METILKISFIISILGILLLLFLANYLEPPLTNLRDINDKMINQKVKVQGTIFLISDKETFKILSMSDETGKIDVLCECNNIDNNQKIEVQGAIKEYREYLQIQADKIKKI